MPKERTTEAAWSDKYKRWSIKVRQDGQRKAFYSSTPGRRGKFEAERKADAWLADNCREAPKDILFDELTDLYLAHIRVGNCHANLKKQTSVINAHLLPR